MRCWLCGAKPEMVDASTFRDAQPYYVPGRWPASTDGHQHAVNPPTPNELEQAGHEALSRIYSEACRS